MIKHFYFKQVSLVYVQYSFFAKNNPCNFGEILKEGPQKIAVIRRPLSI